MASLRNLDTVYFDGTCGLCHWFVRLLLRLDRSGQLYQFAHGAQDSVIVQTASGERLTRSTAVIYAFQRAGGFWSIMASLLQVFPVRFRDLVYDWIARNRRRWIKACPLMPPEFRQRFLS